MGMYQLTREHQCSINLRVQSNTANRPKPASRDRHPWWPWRGVSWQGLWLRSMLPAMQSLHCVIRVDMVVWASRFNLSYSTCWFAGVYGELCWGLRTDLRDQRMRQVFTMLYITTITMGILFCSRLSPLHSHCDVTWGASPNFSLEFLNINKEASLRAQISKVVCDFMSMMGRYHMPSLVYCIYYCRMSPCVLGATRVCK